MLGRVLTLPPLRFGLLVRRSLPDGSGYWLDIPALRHGLLVDAPMAAGHQSSNPTRKRGSIRVVLDFISHRRPCHSRDRKLLSC
jgi:hypothetical protein